MAFGGAFFLTGPEYAWLSLFGYIFIGGALIGDEASSGGARLQYSRNVVVLVGVALLLAAQFLRCMSELLNL
jgi:hypothetical protein